MKTGAARAAPVRCLPEIATACDDRSRPWQHHPFVRPTIPPSVAAPMASMMAIVVPQAPGPAASDAVSAACCAASSTSAGTAAQGSRPPRRPRSAPLPEPRLGRQPPWPPEPRPRRYPHRRGKESQRAGNRRRGQPQEQQERGGPGDKPVERSIRLGEGRRRASGHPAADEEGDEETETAPDPGGGAPGLGIIPAKGADAERDPQHRQEQENRERRDNAGDDRSPAHPVPHRHVSHVNFHRRHSHHSCHRGRGGILESICPVADDSALGSLEGQYSSHPPPGQFAGPGEPPHDVRGPRVRRSPPSLLHEPRLSGHDARRGHRCAPRAETAAPDMDAGCSDEARDTITLSVQRFSFHRIRVTPGRWRHASMHLPCQMTRGNGSCFVWERIGTDVRRRWRRQAAQDRPGNAIGAPSLEP